MMQPVLVRAALLRRRARLASGLPNEQYGEVINVICI